MVENAAYRLAVLENAEEEGKCVEEYYDSTYTGLVYKISNELEEKERRNLRLR